MWGVCAGGGGRVGWGRWGGWGGGRGVLRWCRELVTRRMQSTWEGLNLGRLAISRGSGSGPGCCPAAVAPDAVWGGVGWGEVGWGAALPDRRRSLPTLLPPPLCLAPPPPPPTSSHPWAPIRTPPSTGIPPITQPPSGARAPCLAPPPLPLCAERRRRAERRTRLAGLWALRGGLHRRGRHVSMPGPRTAGMRAPTCLPGAGRQRSLAPLLLLLLLPGPPSHAPTPCPPPHARRYVALQAFRRMAFTGKQLQVCRLLGPVAS